MSSWTIYLIDTVSFLKDYATIAAAFASFLFALLCIFNNEFYEKKNSRYLKYLILSIVISIILIFIPSKNTIRKIFVFKNITGDYYSKEELEAINYIFENENDIEEEKDEE